MKLNASGGNFELAPEGMLHGVLVDVIDMGYQDDRFNPGKTVHQLKLSFQTEDKTTAGTPFVVSTYPFTASLSSKANVTKFLKTMLGKDISEVLEKDKDGDVNLDDLIGTNAMVQVTYTTKTDKTYANVTAAVPMPKSIKTVLEPEGYTRVEDREDAPDVTHSGVEDEDVPY